MAEIQEIEAMDCSPRKEYFPLASQQVIYWNTGRIASNVSYGAPGVSAYSLIGKLNVDALVRSFNWIVERHDALRFRIEIADGVIGQTIASPCEFGVEIIDLTGCKSPLEVAKALIECSAKRCENIVNNSLFRVRIFKVSADQSILELTNNHIISDRQSCEILFKELSFFYNSLSERGSVGRLDWPAQFSEYVVWQKQWFSSEESKRHTDYERNAVAAAKLIGPPESLRAPSDRKIYQVEVCDLSSQQVTRLTRFATSCGMSLSFLLSTIYAYVLSRWSGSEEVVVYSIFNGRRQPRFLNTFGCFAYPILVRVRLKKDAGFAEALRIVPRFIINAYLHYGAMSQALTEWTAGCGFAFLDENELRPTLDGLTISALNCPPHAVFENNPTHCLLTVFRAIVRTDNSKVLLGTNMLSADAMVPLIRRTRELIDEILAR